MQLPADLYVMENAHGKKVGLNFAPQRIGRISIGNFGSKLPATVCGGQPYCTRRRFGNHSPMKPEDLQKLVTLPMPYGKYKGRVIADLPSHYLNWFAREGFPGGELGRLLALMQEMDHNGLKPLLDPLRQAKLFK
ncbi:DUF3820 family protein [Methylomonas methanica]|nr:DUF3820 family protein [Methylomonas methanica]